MTEPTNPQVLTPSPREHLFISYASEDWAFAQWIGLKLIGEGYKVWCDRLQLLGGESYPRDIDDAIKNRTFRVLALLSHNSIHKQDPVKERTLALNLGKARHQDFLIPLNLDGLQASELDWMTSDITFIPFSDSWANGLGRLLKKLQQVNAPRNLGGGRDIVAQWANRSDVVVARSERLWSNMLMFQAVPEHVLRVSSDKEIIRHFRDWPHHRENDNAVWVFEVPPEIQAASAVVSRQVPWRHREVRESIKPRLAVSSLLRQYLARHCQKRGMALTPTDPIDPYFPAGIADEGWLKYTMPSGRKSSILAVGVRRFRRLGGETVPVHYHLCPVFYVKLDLLEQPIVFVRPRLYLTDSKGGPLPPKIAFRRQKRIRKTWWNSAWLPRVLAIAHWITNGEHEVNLALMPGTKIVLGRDPLTATAPLALDESKLERVLDEEEDEMSDEDPGSVMPVDEEGDDHA